MVRKRSKFCDAELPCGIVKLSTAFCGVPEFTTVASVPVLPSSLCQPLWLQPDRQDLLLRSGRDRTGIHRKTSAVITTTKIHKDGDSFLLSVSQFAVTLSYQDMHHLYFPVTLRSRPICTKQPVLFLLCAEKQNAALYSAQFHTHINHRSCFKNMVDKQS